MMQIKPHLNQRLTFSLSKSTFSRLLQLKILWVGGRLSSRILGQACRRLSATNWTGVLATLSEFRDAELASIIN